MPVVAVSKALKLPTPPTWVRMLAGRMPFTFAEATATVLILPEGIRWTVPAVVAVPASVLLEAPGSMMSVPAPWRMILKTERSL